MYSRALSKLETTSGPLVRLQCGMNTVLMKRHGEKWPALEYSGRQNRLEDKQV